MTSPKAWIEFCRANKTKISQDNAALLYKGHLTAQNDISNNQIQFIGSVGIPSLSQWEESTWVCILATLLLQD